MCDVMRTGIAQCTFDGFVAKILAHGTHVEEFYKVVLLVAIYAIDNAEGLVKCS